MTKEITVSVKIISSKEAKSLIERTLDKITDACNFVSDYVWSTNLFDRRKVHNALYKDLRQEFGLKAQAARLVLNQVLERYNNLPNHENLAQPLIFENYDYNFRWSREYTLNKDGLSLSTLTGRLQLRYESEDISQYFDDGIYKFGAAKLLCQDGHYYLQVNIIGEIPQPKHNLKLNFSHQGLTALSAEASEVSHIPEALPERAEAELIEHASPVNTVRTPL